MWPPPWQEYQIDDNFHNEYVMDEDHRNLPGGQYVIRVDYHPAHDMGFVEGPSSLVIMEGEPRCDITLWDILLETNNSSAHIQYDLDCGDDANAEGFNVSVQFWNTVANTPTPLIIPLDSTIFKERQVIFKNYICITFLVILTISNG